MAEFVRKPDTLEEILVDSSTTATGVSDFIGTILGGFNQTYEPEIFVNQKDGYREFVVLYQTSVQPPTVFRITDNSGSYLVVKRTYSDEGDKSTSEISGSAVSMFTNDAYEEL